MPKTDGGRIPKINHIPMEEIQSSEQTVTGVIVRIHDDSPGPVFYIKDYDQNLVRVSMPEDYRTEVINYMNDRTPVKLYGSGAKKNRLEIHVIHDLIPEREIWLRECKGIELKRELTADLSFEKFDDAHDFWVVSNEKLGVHGVGATVSEAQGLFMENLYDHYVMYKELSDSQMVSEAIVQKKKFISFFEGGSGYGSESVEEV